MKIESLKRILTIALILGAACLCAGRTASSAELENIAPGCAVSTSPLPNALWNEHKAVDNNTGPTMGWLGLVGGPKDKPWLYFRFPSSTNVSSIELLAASFKETGPNRFSRPKSIIVDFTYGKKATRLTFEMKDSETEFQKFEFVPVKADAMRITIDSIYTSGAKINDMAGFMEVRILSPDSVAKQEPSSSTIGGEETNDSGSQLEYKEEVKSNSPAGDSGEEASGTLSEDEKEILDMLRELINRLEKKFRED